MYENKTSHLTIQLKETSQPKRQKKLTTIKKRHTNQTEDSRLPDRQMSEKSASLEDIHKPNRQRQTNRQTEAN